MGGMVTQGSLFTFSQKLHEVHVFLWKFLYFLFVVKFNFESEEIESQIEDIREQIDRTENKNRQNRESIDRKKKEEKRLSVQYWIKRQIEQRKDRQIEDRRENTRSRSPVLDIKIDIIEKKKDRKKSRREETRSSVLDLQMNR